MDGSHWVGKSLILARPLKLNLAVKERYNRDILQVFAAGAQDTEEGELLGPGRTYRVQRRSI